MEDGWIDRAAEELIRHVIGKCRAIALAVAFQSAAKTGKDVLVLLRARDRGDDRECGGVERGTEAELELLLRHHGRSVPVEGHIEVGNDAEHALLNRDLHLLL